MEQDNKKSITDLEKRMSAAESNSRATSEALASKLGMTEKELDSRTAELLSSQRTMAKNQEDKLNKVTGAIADEVGNVKTDVASTRTDLEATKAKLELAKLEHKRARKFAKQARNMASEATEQASDFVRTHAPGKLTRKGDRDLASEIDVSIEDSVRKFLHALTPDAAFLGEEQGVAGPHPARPVLPVVPGGEEPLGQRAVGDDQAVLLLSERQ